MNYEIVHFPVGNGDMTLIRAGDRYILTDLNIRKCSEQETNQCDVAHELYAILPRDAYDRPYVDVLVLTHPDDDHCRGFEAYFHTGSIGDYRHGTADNGRDKIIAREIWFSDIVYKRISDDHKLGADAQKFRTEATRRKNLFKKYGVCDQNESLKIIGDHQNADPDWRVEGLVHRRGENLSVGSALAHILSPMDDEIFDDLNEKDKNDSSVMLQWAINGNKILICGDLGVHPLKYVWEENKNNVSNLEYDLLLVPHHCSWHSLSYQNSDDPNAVVCQDALNALSQVRPGAIMVASSKPIKATDPNPPSHKAKQEYLKILGGDATRFVCLADTGTSTKPPKIKKYILGVGGLIPAATSSSVNSSSFEHSKEGKRSIDHG